jgi:3-hydroxy-5-methyl-1-naphthoate 3-O-methyltransferase
MVLARRREFMQPFRHHVLVCTQAKPEGATSCPGNHSWQVLQALETELCTRGLDDEVQVSACSCLGLCDDGPVMIVYPEGVWYREVREEDVAEIVSSHLRSGKVVPRLAWSDAQAMKTEAIEHREHYRAMVKARDEAGMLPEDLNELIRGFMSSRAVLTALELDVFTAIGEGSSADEVANKMDGDERATEMLLNALVSLKLLEKRDRTFLNTPVSTRFLAEGARDNARPGLMHIAHLWDRWSRLTESVKAGTSVERREREPHDVQDFIAAMDRNAKERAAAVVKAVGTNGVRRMLDLGGGSGAYSIALARAMPNLNSEILDQAEVIPLTHAYIRKAGLEDRVTTRVGNMLRDPLGKNYDLVLASAICHMFSAEENCKLFRRIYEALAPHGKVVVQDFILEPGKTSPRFAALFSLNMLVGTKAGGSYSEPEYAKWLQNAGFSGIRRVRLPGPAGLMIGLRN